MRKEDLQERHWHLESGTVKNNIMKKVIKKAATYESKKSLDGKMKFLKGNVGKTVKPKNK